MWGLIITTKFNYLVVVRVAFVQGGTMSRAARHVQSGFWPSIARRHHWTNRFTSRHISTLISSTGLALSLAPQRNDSSSWVVCARLAMEYILNTPVEMYCTRETHGPPYPMHYFFIYNKLGLALSMQTKQLSTKDQE